MSKVAIGIGCRKNVPGKMIAALVRRALEVADLPVTGAGIFSIEDKREEVGVQEAARLLALPLIFLPRDQLAHYNGKGATRSQLVQAQFGLDSVCEAAALAGAGHGSTLVLPRISDNGATCAIAIGAAP